MIHRRLQIIMREETNKPFLSGKTREMIVAPQFVNLTERSPFLSSYMPTFFPFGSEPETLANPEAARRVKQSSTQILAIFFLAKNEKICDNNLMRWGELKRLMGVHENSVRRRGLSKHRHKSESSLVIMLKLSRCLAGCVD